MIANIFITPFPFIADIENQDARADQSKGDSGTYDE
jgi:hypothetical protein